MQAAGSGGGFAPISIAVDEASTVRAGREAREALDAGLTPVVEGANVYAPDAGIGFLEGLTELRAPRASEASASQRLDALRQMIARGVRVLRKKDIIAAASTMRPLLGMNSVMAIGVNLEAREVQDRALNLLLSQLLATPPASLEVPPSDDAASSASAASTASTSTASTSAARALPLLEGGGSLRAETLGPGRLPGSGAGGGAAAIIAAIGGRILHTGDVLAAATGLREAVAGADLIITLEPELHSPQLSESLLSTVTQAAARVGVPVVGLGCESSLSGYERAEWGLHGQFIAAEGVTLRQAGQRIARTWAV